MKIPKSDNPLIEELHWLQENKNFQKAVSKLRKTYNIPQKGFVAAIEYNDWVKKGFPKKQLKFEQEFTKLAKKCRFYHSRHKANFVHSLKVLVISNKLRTLGDKLSRAYPQILIARCGNAVKIELLLDFDTELGKVKEILSMHIKQIKAVQKEIAKAGKLKGSPNFEMNVKIWEMGKNSKPKQVLELLPPNITEQDIYKLTARLKKRILDSFD